MGGGGWEGGRRHRLVDILIRPKLLAGRTGVHISVGASSFPVPKNAHTGPGDHPDSYSVGIGILPRGVNLLAVQLPTHIHLLPKLKMSGAMHLLPPYTPSRRGKV